MTSKEYLFDSRLPAPAEDTERIIVVRHGQDDESVIDGSFNNSLTEDGLADIDGLSEAIAQIFYETERYSEVRILHSGKMRTHQTALLVADFLGTAGISVSTRGIDSLRELYQGEMALSDELTLEDKSQVLHAAWRLYGGAVEKCDLHYRFGDPSRQLEDVTNENDLEGKFTAYGENQLEFSQRIYTFLRDILQYDFGTSLPIVVGHRATVTKIQRLIGACSVANGYIDNMQPGELRFVEREVDRVEVGYAEGVVLPLRHKLLARDVIGRELNYLQEHN